MSESKTLTIQLSSGDNTRLEAEAKRLNLSPDALASIILHDRLADVKPQAELWTLDGPLYRNAAGQGFAVRLLGE